MVWPEFRTAKYSIWMACERLGVFPPNVKIRWEDNPAPIQAEILSYDQIRQHEENERFKAQLGVPRL